MYPWKAMGCIAFITFGATASLLPTFRSVTELHSRTDAAIAQTHAQRLHAAQQVKQMETRLIEAPMMCQGRLTLTSGTPITTSDVSDTSTLYFTPYQGNRIALYDVGSTRWEFHTFSEISTTLSGLTASLPYDVFAYDSSGTVTLELSPWSTATARVVADDLISQDGVFVRTGEIDRRYLGTIYTTSTTTTRDTETDRFVWNYTHRVPRILRVRESVNTYVYNSTTRRQVNANTANQVNYIMGWDEYPVFGSALHVVLGQTANRLQNIMNCIAENSTNTCTTTSFRGGGAQNTIRSPLWAESNHLHGMGFNFLSWSEAAANDTGATDPLFIGDDSSDGRVQTGMIVLIWG